MKTKLGIISILGILSLFILCHSFKNKNNENIIHNIPLQNDSIKTSINDTVTIIGVGDIMMGTNYPNKGYLPPNDGKEILLPVKHLLLDADITFGNLEGGFLNEGGTPKGCKDPSKCYVFRMPEHYVNYLVDAGFDVMSIANNHVGDFGDAGRQKTTEVLKKAGIYYAGQTTCESATFEINNIKYGFVAFAPNTGTIDIRDISNAQRIVRKLDSISDIVIVSFHGGAEGAKHRNVSNKTEIFLDENRGNVVEFSHKVIDAGADIVFGHGPHITRAVELHKNRFIAYSLGNFCTYARFNLNGHNGVAPIIKVYTTKTGEFIKGQIFSIKQPGEGGPVLDNNNTALKEIKELTAIDFPNTPIIIDNSGLIRKK